MQNRLSLRAHQRPPRNSPFWWPKASQSRIQFEMSIFSEFLRGSCLCLFWSQSAPLFTRPLAPVPWRQWVPPISRRPSRPPSSSGPSGPGTPSLNQLVLTSGAVPPLSSSSIHCSSQFVQYSSPRPCTRRLTVSPPVFQVGVVFRFHPPRITEQVVGYSDDLVLVPKGPRFYKICAFTAKKIIFGCSGFENLFSSPQS